MPHFKSGYYLTLLGQAIQFGFRGDVAEAGPLISVRDMAPDFYSLGALAIVEEPIPDPIPGRRITKSVSAGAAIIQDVPELQLTLVKPDELQIITVLNDLKVVGNFTQ